MGMVLIAVLIALVVWVMFSVNWLMRLRNLVRAGWADIDVQLMRRHDLVPMLVKAVRGYAFHEKATLDSVPALRGQVMQTRSPAQLAGIEQSLGQGVGRLLLLREAYRELNASENFLQLQRNLFAVEDHLQYARRFYNGAVRGLNDAVQKFPDLIVARMFGFSGAEFFEAGEGTRAAPKVELSP